MQEDYAKEEEKITGEFAGDPLLKIKSREVDLKAMDIGIVFVFLI